MSIKVSPSILAADFANLSEECSKIDNSNADWFHLDIAGPGRSRENSLVYPKGGTAFGLISLFNFIKNFN